MMEALRVARISTVRVIGGFGSDVRGSGVSIARVYVEAGVGRHVGQGRRRRVVTPLRIRHRVGVRYHVLRLACRRAARACHCRNREHQRPAPHGGNGIAFAQGGAV